MTPIELCQADREIAVRIRARFPLIYIVSPEGRRVQEQLCAVREEVLGKDIAAMGVDPDFNPQEWNRRGRPLYVWTRTSGLQCNGRQIHETEDPLKALDAILQPPKPPESDSGIYVFHDLHPYMDPAHRTYDPVVVRKLRDINEDFQNRDKTLVIVSPVQVVPPELEKEMTVVDYPLPTAEQLDAYLRAHEAGIVETYGPGCIQLNGEDRREFLQKSVGLTYNEVVNVWAKSLEKNKRLSRDDIATITEEKRQIIEKSGLLEYYPSAETFAQLGGLTRLKSWLRERENAFKGKLAGRKLPPLKGILLIGIPGCGKSLSAKAVSAEWRLPLVRLDVGRIYEPWLGRSEANFRNAMKIVRRLAPVVLWIDEVEKGFPQTSAVSDSGTSMRVLSSFLTWMQEKTEPVFVVATANDIERMPWELTRKGRFDEIFYVGLPTSTERSQILKIHLGTYSITLSSEEEADLVNRTDCFTGAEIEQAVTNALHRMPLAPEPGSPPSLFAALRDTVAQMRPLALRLEDNPKFQDMQKKAMQIAVPASEVEPQDLRVAPPLKGWRK